MSERGWLVQIPLRAPLASDWTAGGVDSITEPLRTRLLALGIDRVAIHAAADGVDAHVVLDLDPDHVDRSVTGDQIEALAKRTLGLLVQHNLLPRGTRLDTDMTAIWHEDVLP
jgi:hypothetical protein